MRRHGRGDCMVVRALEDDGCAVTLRGEFDVLREPALGATLSAALEYWRSVFVDLSGVTFLDGSCARELALLGGLYGDRLVLGNPSREVEVSVNACGMEDLIRFRRQDRPEKWDRPRRGTRGEGRAPRAARETGDDRSPVRR